MFDIIILKISSYIYLIRFAKSAMRKRYRVSRRFSEEKSFRLNRSRAYRGPRGSRGGGATFGLARYGLIIPRGDDDRV